MATYQEDQIQSATALADLKAATHTLEASVAKTQAALKAAAPILGPLAKENQDWDWSERPVYPTKNEVAADEAITEAHCALSWAKSIGTEAQSLIDRLEWRGEWRYYRGASLEHAEKMSALASSLERVEKITRRLDEARRGLEDLAADIAA